MQVDNRAAAGLQLDRTKHSWRRRSATTACRLLDSRMSIDRVCVAHHSHKNLMQQVLSQEHANRTSIRTVLVQHARALTLVLRPVSWVKPAARFYDGSSHIVRQRARGVEETGVCGRTHAAGYCVQIQLRGKSRADSCLRGLTCQPPRPISLRRPWLHSSVPLHGNCASIQGAHPCDAATAGPPHRSSSACFTSPQPLAHPATKHPLAPLIRY